MTVFGYARVSTDGQSLSAQLAELKAAKCAKIFQEKISGARSDRKQLTRLMAVLAKGDVLVDTQMRQDISGEDQRCSVRPQAANAVDGGPGKGGRIGCHPARSIGEVHERSP